MNLLNTSSVTINSFFFFFNDTATPEIYPLSLPDALPICLPGRRVSVEPGRRARTALDYGLENLLHEGGGPLAEKPPTGDGRKRRLVAFAKNPLDRPWLVKDSAVGDSRVGRNQLERRHPHFLPHRNFADGDPRPVRGGFEQTALFARQFDFGL